MSPGATFERVYNELKRMLAEGELPPGTPIEPALIGKEIAASITPVRDALHRLTGQRLVEAPNHNGFRVPLPTEAELRDLYAWNAQMLALAVRRIGPTDGARIEMAPQADDVVAGIATLFTGIAARTGSGEHIRAIRQLNDRLATYRASEVRLFADTSDEYAQLLDQVVHGDPAGLARELSSYHRRRTRAVAEILSGASQGDRG